MKEVHIISVPIRAKSRYFWERVLKEYWDGNRRVLLKPHSQTELKLLNFSCLRAHIVGITIRYINWNASIELAEAYAPHFMLWQNCLPGSFFPLRPPRVVQNPLTHVVVLLYYSVLSPDQFFVFLTGVQVFLTLRRLFSGNRLVFRPKVGQITVTVIPGTLGCILKIKKNNINKLSWWTLQISVVWAVYVARFLWVVLIVITCKYFPVGYLYHIWYTYNLMHIKSKKWPLLFYDVSSGHNF